MAEDKLDLLPGTLEMLILQTLQTGNSMHGYGILRRIEQMSGKQLSIEEGSLYPALHRMERRGWIIAEWRKSELNRNARYYTLTTDGTARLKERTSEWRSLTDAIGRIIDPQRAPARES